MPGSLREKLRDKLGKYRTMPSQNQPQISIHIQPPTPNPSTNPDLLPPGQLNQTMYQAFEWYTPSDPHTPNHSHWSYLRTQLPHLSALGISTLWLPPGCKAGNPHGNGYDIYDLWDLGEFDWKGQRPTKWGSKEELVSLCRAAREHRIGVIWDAVLNHRSSADFCEEVLAVPVSAQDRTKEIGREREILAWTRFDFPARKGRYSGLRLTKEDFNAIDWDDKRKERGIFRWSDRRWASDVDGELGNYDFLMGANLDYHTSKALRNDVINWGLWIVRELGLSGFRLDAMKHMSQSFILEFMTRLQEEFGHTFFFLGEYWKWGDSAFLVQMAKKMQGRCRLYDVQLFYNFSDFSLGKKRDLRRVLEGSLVEVDPGHAVTIVATHDTQPTQTLHVLFSPWFLPHAYTLNLLRACPSLPCIFHGHLHGLSGPEPQPPLPYLPTLMQVRRSSAYGTQYNYWDDDPECIGWTRVGRDGPTCSHEGCVILLSISKKEKGKKMFAGVKHGGAVFTDLLGGGAAPDVKIGEDGMGMFTVQPRCAAVWVRKPLNREISHFSSDTD